MEVMSKWNGVFSAKSNRCQPRFLPFVSRILGFTTDQYSTGIEKLESALIERFITNFSQLLQVNEFSRRMLQLLDH
jgi:hypothetical protein